MSFEARGIPGARALPDMLSTTGRAVSVRLSDPLREPDRPAHALDLFDRAKLRPRFWILVGLLMLQGVFEFFDFFIVGFLVSMIGPAWGLTFGETSVILLAAGVGQLLGAMPFAWVADTWGRKPALIAGMMVYSLAAGCTAFVPEGSWMLFACLRFLVGVGYGGTQITLLIEIAPTRIRTILASSTGLVAPLGVLAASLLVATLSGTLGWRGLALLGFAPIGMVIALWFFVPESVRWLIAQGRGEEARKVVSQYVDIPYDRIPLIPEPARREPPRLRDLYRYPGRFWMIIFMTAGLGMSGFGVALWGPTVVSMLLRASPAEAAQYFVYVSASGLVGRALWTLAPHFIGRWRSALICCWGAAASIAGAALLHPYFIAGIPVFLICLIIGALFYDGGYANTTPFGTELYPVRLAALGGGLTQTTSGLAKLLGPVALALIAGSGNVLSPAATEAAIVPGFLFLATFAVMGGIALLLLRYETNGRPMVIDEAEWVDGRPAIKSAGA